MNSLLPGVLVFVAFTGLMSGFIIFTIQKARAQDIKGVDLLKKLLPFLLADIAFVFIFVFWLMQSIY